jgi:hypothetical protein
VTGCEKSTAFDSLKKLSLEKHTSLPAATSVTKETKQILATLTTFAIVVTFCSLPLMLQPNLRGALYVFPLDNSRVA